MATIDDLAARLDRLEQLLREARATALPSGRTEVTAEIRAAMAAGQKGVSARLDDVWTAVTEGTGKVLGSVADLAAVERGATAEPDLSPVLDALDASASALDRRLNEIRSRLDRDPVAAIDALSARVANLEHAVADAIRATPRTDGAMAGVPELIAEPLESIDGRLSAVERMAREQFELDQRLRMVDDTLQGLTGPFNDLLPTLRHVADIVDWLGRMEQRLQSVATQLAPLVLRNQELGELTGLMHRVGDAVAALPVAHEHVEPEPDPAPAPLAGTHIINATSTPVVDDRLDEVLGRLGDLEEILARLGDLQEVPAQLARLDEELGRVGHPTPASPPAVTATDEPGPPDPRLDDIIATLHELTAATVAPTPAPADPRLDDIAAEVHTLAGRLDPLDGLAQAADQLTDVTARLDQIDERSRDDTTARDDAAARAVSTVESALQSLGEGMAQTFGPMSARVAAVEGAVDGMAARLFDEIAAMSGRLETLSVDPSSDDSGPHGDPADRPSPMVADLSPLADRLSAIESSLAALLGATPAAMPDAEARATLANIERSLASLGPPLDARLQRLETTMTTASAPVDARLAQLERAVNELAPVASKLAKIEAAMTSAAEGAATEADAMVERLDALADGRATRLRDDLAAAVAQQLQGSAEDQRARLRSELADALAERLDTVADARNASLRDELAAVLADRWSGVADAQQQAMADEVRRSSLELAISLPPMVAQAVGGAAPELQAAMRTTFEGALADTSAADRTAVGATVADAVTAATADIQRAVQAVTTELAGVVDASARAVAARLDEDGAAREATLHRIDALDRELRALAASVGTVSSLGDQVSRIEAAVVDSPPPAADLGRMAADLDNTRERVVDLDRKVTALRTEIADDDRVARSVFQAAQAVASLAEAVEGLERRFDADLTSLGRRIDSLVSKVDSTDDDRHDDDRRARTAETVAQRISRLRDVAAGVSDAARTELRRRRGEPPELGRGG